MAKCESCGAEVGETDQFCPGCGASRATAAAAAPLNPPGPVPPPPPPGQPSPPAGSIPPPPMPPAPGQPAYAQAPVGPPKKRKGLPKGAKIALIVGGIAVALIVVAIVLIAIFFVGVISGPADAANGYVKALNEGQLVTAWNYLADETKTEESRTDFDASMGELEGNIEKWFTSSIHVETGGRAYVKMDLTLTGNEEATWYMYLVKDGDKWKLRTVSSEILPGFEED